MKSLKRVTLVMIFLSLIISQGNSQNTAVSDAKQDAGISQSTVNPVPGNFVDKNNDGVCDHYQARMKKGHGPNFVDKNGNGICDTRGTTGNLKRNRTCCGQGFQHRHRHGNHNCGGCFRMPLPCSM